MAVFAATAEGVRGEHVLAPLIGQSQARLDGNGMMPKRGGRRVWLARAIDGARVDLVPRPMSVAGTP
jgi:hypothetical protein